jgi:hypothetical protein
MSPKFASLRATARAAAAGALITAISAATLGGVAAGSPPAQDEQGCSVLAHERNAGRHRLHTAWKKFRAELQEMSRESRTAERLLRKTETSTLLVEALGDVQAARAELDAIRTAAHAEIQSLAELGTACKDPAPAPDELPRVTLVTVLDPDAKEGDTVEVLVQFNKAVECEENCEDAFTYDANGADDPAGTTATELELAEDGMSAELTFTANADVDGSKDTLAFESDAASFKDEDENAMADDSDEAVELSLTTNDLVAKYRDVVDQAIREMQEVVDGVSADVTALVDAAEEGDLSKAPKAEEGKRGDKEHGKPDKKGKPDNAGNRGRDRNK